MQHLFRIRLIAAFAAVLFLGSCSKTNKPGRMVPRDAGFIMHWNSKSLSGKINMAELKQADWYKQMTDAFQNDTSSRNELMNKFRNLSQSSGVDSLSDFVFFMDNSGGTGTKMVLEGGIKDASKFESFVKTVYPVGNITKDGELQVMNIEDKAILIWNSDKMVVGFQLPERSRNSFNNDNGNNNEMDKPMMTAYCKHLYNLKEDSSMAKDEKFTDLINTEGDLHAWVNFEKLVGNMPQMGMLSMMKMDNIFNGNITAYTLNFENGKISLKSRGYAGKELNDLLKKYNGGGINTDMLKNIPSNDVVGVFAMHFKPEGLKELVKLTGMDGFIDLMLAHNGFTIDDFVKANKGDILFAVSDLTMKKDTVKFGGEEIKMDPIIVDKPDAKVLFAASINDKDAFSKLINFAKKQGGEEFSDKINYNSNKDYFVLGNSAVYNNKFLAGGKTELPFLNKMSGSPYGMYIDLQKILKLVGQQGIKDSLGKKAMDESLKIWENVMLTGGDYSNGGTNQVLEINMVDKNTNSLKQLFRYMATMTMIEKEKKMQYTAMTDTTVAVMPPEPMPVSKSKTRKAKTN